METKRNGMEMYKQYCEERYDGKKSVYYTDKGWASYWIKEKEVYIEDIYVEAKYRADGVASDLANKIAEIGRKNGCTYMMGSVVPSTLNSTASLKVLLGYGFKLHSAESNFIWFIKDL